MTLADQHGSVFRPRPLLFATPIHADCLVSPETIIPEFTGFGRAPAWFAALHTAGDTSGSWECRWKSRFARSTWRSWKGRAL